MVGRSIAFGDRGSPFGDRRTASADEGIAMTRGVFFCMDSMI
jgi:hypothetical protein